MSNYFVSHLQKSLIDHSKKTSELLDLALFVARKFKQEDACLLLESEHHGFGPNEKIPEYRLLFGDIIFIYDGVEQVVNVNGMVREQMMSVRLSISEIESICDDCDQAFLYLDINSDKIEKQCREQLIRYKLKPFEYAGGADKFTSDLIEQSVGKINLKLKIHKLKYSRIIKSVRDIIQRWSITLDGQSFDCDCDMFTEEKEMTKVNNYSINNLNGILGDVVHSNVSQSNNVTAKGDNSLLRQSLKEQLVPSEDIDEISEILINSEPPKNKDSFPIKVNEWIKKMLDKSLDGSWGVSIASAGGVLSQIICRYFGIN